MPPDDHYFCTPTEVDLKLRLGIERLLLKKYLPLLGSQANLLAAGLVNWTLCDSPETSEAKMFAHTNADMIEQEATKLHQDPKLRHAFSVLYAFTLIWLGPTNPDKSARLVDRASELNILILSAKEICAAADPFQFLTFIDKYANEVLLP
jgi:hypothetical protein